MGVWVLVRMMTLVYGACDELVRGKTLGLGLYLTSHMSEGNRRIGTLLHVEECFAVVGLEGWVHISMHSSRRLRKNYLVIRLISGMAVWGGGHFLTVFVLVGRW